MIKGVAAVWLPVTDMSRAVSFYGDTLGLDVTEYDGDWN
jgi:predicted enzyme related to lactoylglutathione lyase